MTWEEIEPIAALFLGESCGKLTLEDLWTAATKLGYRNASSLVDELEKAGAAYKWVKEESNIPPDGFLADVSRYAKMALRKSK